MHASEYDRKVEVRVHTLKKSTWQSTWYTMNPYIIMNVLLFWPLKRSKLQVQKLKFMNWNRLLQLHTQIKIQWIINLKHIILCKWKNVAIRLSVNIFNYNVGNVSSSYGRKLLLLAFSSRANIIFLAWELYNYWIEYILIYLICNSLHVIIYISILFQFEFWFYFLFSELHSKNNFVDYISISWNKLWIIF